MLLPTQRFSKRVENYVRYRPSYPREIIELLRTECDLTVDSVVADVGSGTGKLTERPTLDRAAQINRVTRSRECQTRLQSESWIAEPRRT